MKVILDGRDYIVSDEVGKLLIYKEEQIKASFRAGAEAARAAILNHMSYYGSTDATVRRDNQIADGIRALPLPEMPE